MADDKENGPVESLVGGLREPARRAPGDVIQARLVEHSYKLVDILTRLSELKETHSSLQSLAEAGQDLSRQLLDEMKGQQQAGPVVARLGERIDLYRGDFERWTSLERRRRRWWAWLFIILVAPAFLALGLLVEQRYQVIPLDDPTGGWRDHVWERYGREIVDCVQVARGERGEVACTFKVRPP